MDSHHDTQSRASGEIHIGTVGAFVTTLDNHLSGLQQLSDWGHISFGHGEARRAWALLKLVHDDMHHLRLLVEVGDVQVRSMSQEQIVRLLQMIGHADERLVKIYGLVRELERMIARYRAEERMRALLAN